MARNIIKIARATEAELSLVKGLLHDYEAVFATDTNRFGIVKPGTDKSIKYMLPAIGGILGSNLDAGKFKITNLAAPTADQDAANKLYVDSKFSETIGGTDLGIIKTGTLNTITSSTGTNAEITGATTTEAGLVTTGAQTWNGTKTFNASPIVPTPTDDSHAVRKSYVDSGLSTKANQSYVEDVVSGLGTDISNVSDSIGDGTLTIAKGGIATLSTTPTFNANQKVDKTITITVPGTDLSATATGDSVTLESSTGSSVDIPTASLGNAGIITTGSQTIKGDKTFDGDTVITGDLTVSGTNFIAETTTVRTEDDLIELRSKGTTPITTPAGIAVKNYDGTNDGGIVIKNDGEVRVGKITIDASGKVSDSSLAQPVLTRAEKAELINDDLLVWDSGKNRAITKNLNTLGIVPTSRTINDKALTSDIILEAADIGAAEESHSHAIADVLGLQATLDGKAEEGHIHDEATTSVAGFLSASDKSKLDNIAVNATDNKGTVTSVSAGTQISGMSMTIDNETTTPTIKTSITNKANFRTAIGAGTSSFSGDYNDLTNTPSIPPAQVQSNWNATTGMGVILNKPSWATEAQAKAGTLTNVFMSPVRTFDAISVAIIDGGDLSELL